ncbi:hypothetical protein R3P38DRAFT_2607538 [Favolaschia claudopus]|uniref:Uncharacterized protein n=1 Tax=Favolaschia claudopus TaxID=2862362 RepID=A0AAW0D739_9AGAR
MAFQNIASSSSVPPSFSPSKTFKRALSFPSLDKPLASIRASSSRGLHRMSSFGKPSPSVLANPSAASSTESIPVFTIPDYTQAIPARPMPSISPLTRPGLKRKLTPKHLQNTVKLPALKKSCQCTSRKPSTTPVASVTSASSTTTASSSSTSRRRRSSSVSTVESFQSSEDKVTVAMHLQSLPSTVSGFFVSVMSILLAFLIFPTMTAPAPKRAPSQREIVVTEEQEKNPPRLPAPPPVTSRLRDSITSAYRRTIRRASRARRASTPGEAFTVFFNSTSKRVRFDVPIHVDPKTLVIDTPIVVYTSPIALPLPKGPAPAVKPVCKLRSRYHRRLTTVKEGEVLDAALCDGW